MRVSAMRIPAVMKPIRATKIVIGSSHCCSRRGTGLVAMSGDGMLTQNVIMPFTTADRAPSIADSSPLTALEAAAPTTGPATSPMMLPAMLPMQVAEVKTGRTARVTVLGGGCSRRARPRWP